MSVYLSVAPPDGFTKWGEAEWDRWLRDHPWEAAERVCSRGDWAIFLYQVRSSTEQGRKFIEPLLEALVNERPLGSEDTEDFELGVQTARKEMALRPGSSMKQSNGMFASADDLEAMLKAARGRVGREPTLADVWSEVFDQLEKVLKSAVAQQRGVYFGNL